MINLITILIVILASLLASVGSLYLKKASSDISGSVKSFFNKWLIIGVASYVVSGATIIYLLKENELSTVYPMTSLTYIFVALLSWKYLDEKINIYKIGSLSLIIVGVILIALN